MFSGHSGAVLTFIWLRWQRHFKGCCKSRMSGSAAR